MVWLCLLLVGVGAAVSLPVVAVMLRLAGPLGMIDQPAGEAHKQHTAAVPSVGGIGIFAAVALPLGAALLAVWAVPGGRWEIWLGAVGAELAEHLPGLRQQTPMACGILTALLVMHVMGVLDDRRRLGPIGKLAVQLLTAGGLAILFDVRVLHLLDQFGPAGTAASMGISVLWIVAITNAINFLDNMDGLAGGVGAVIAGLYLAATLIGGQWFVAAMAALLLGALLGFLVFNLPPARVFMGDGGSLVVGLLLAVISMRTTYFDGHTAEPGNWYGLLMPVMVMAVPLYDLVSVTWIRLRQGKSPMVGDHNHFSHRLVRKGLSRPAAVRVIWLCTLATGVSGVMLSSLAGWQAALAAVQTAAVLAVLAVLERSW